MATPYSDLYIAEARYGNFGSSDDQSWALAECAECDGKQMAVIAYTKENGSRWLRCVNCKAPAVQHYGAQSPSVKPLRVPLGVRGVELSVWREIRDCLSVGANTAAVMMCRKLLLHVAVGHGLAPKNDKGKSPTFMEAVEHLQKEEIITSKMRPWVDRIKDVGNEANHEIEPIDSNVALDVALFTEQLLRLAYEMDAIMASAQDESEP